MSDKEDVGIFDLKKQEITMPWHKDHNCPRHMDT